MILLLPYLTLAPAYAQDDAPCEVTTPGMVDELLDDAEGELLEAKLDGARDLLDASYNALRCLEAPAAPSQVARFAQGKAMLSFFAQDEEGIERWGAVFRTTAPTIPWPIPDAHPVVERASEVEPPAITGPEDAGLAVPKRGGILLNGWLLSMPRTHSDIPGLLQVVDRDGVVVSARWIDGAMFPAEWLSDKQKSPAPPEWYEAEDLTAAARDLVDRREAAASERAGSDAVCTMSDGEFRTLASAARSAAAGGEWDAHAEQQKILRQQGPCMTGQIPPDAWAEYLVSVATWQYANDESWQGAVSTALVVSPKVDRSYTPKPIKSYSTTPEPPSNEDPLPPGPVVFLDGLLIQVPPSRLIGPHVVQRLYEGAWETRFLENASFPKEWTIPPEAATTGDPLPEPVPKKPRKPKGERDFPTFLVAGGAALAVGGASAGLALMEGGNMEKATDVDTLDAAYRRQVVFGATAYTLLAAGTAGVVANFAF